MSEMHFTKPCKAEKERYSHINFGDCRSRHRSQLLCWFLIITFFHLYTSLSPTWDTSNSSIDAMLEVQDGTYSAQIWFWKGPDSVYFLFEFIRIEDKVCYSVSLRARLFWTFVLFISKYKTKRQLQQFLIQWCQVLLQRCPLK